MLNIQTEHLENHTARLTVEIDEQRLERAMVRAGREIAKKGRIPGFRPGKAPLNVVMNLYGREYVLGEAYDSLGNDVYREALEQAEIDPYAAGTLENVDQETRTMTFVVPLRPSVELGDYRAIRAEHEVEEVSDQMVEDALENLREEQAELEPVDRAAEMGDRLTFDHIEIVLLKEDTDEDDEDDDEDEDDDRDEDENEDDERDDDADESEDADEDNDNEVDSDEEDEDDEHDEDEHSHGDDEDVERVVLHQHEWDRVLRDDERDLFPGFSAQLVGLNAGDHTDFTLDVPDDFDTEELRGRTIRVDAHVEQVRSRVLPDWSDELAAQISSGEQETIDELRAAVRKQLEEAAQNIAEQKTLDEALERLVSEATIHYPEDLLQDYLGDLLEEFDRSLRQQGLTLQDFIKITGQSEEQISQQFRPRAVERAERALALGKLVDEEELAVSDEDIEAEVDAMANALGGDQAGRFKQFLMSDQSRLNIANRLATSRATGRLVAIARGENPPKGPAPQDEQQSTPATVAAIETPEEPAATKGQLEADAPREDARQEAAAPEAEPEDLEPVAPEAPVEVDAQPDEQTDTASADE